MNPIFYNLCKHCRRPSFYLLLWTSCLLISLQAKAQSEDEEEMTGTEFIYGVNLNSNAGLIGGAIFRYSRPLTERMFEHVGLEIVNVKHPKEFRFQGSGNTFIYAKSNYLFSIRPHYGRELLIFKKAPDEGVRINLLASVGPSIGLIKPYFVELAISQSQTIIVQYDPTNPAHSPGNILGSAGLLRFNGSTLAAGLHAKLGVTFVLGNFRSSVTGFEVGTLAEVYNREIPIFQSPEIQNKQFFTSVYLNLFFGGRK